MSTAAHIPSSAIARKSSVPESFARPKTCIDVSIALGDSWDILCAAGNHLPDDYLGHKDDWDARSILLDSMIALTAARLLVCALMGAGGAQ